MSASTSHSVGPMPTVGSRGSTAKHSDRSSLQPKLDSPVNSYESDNELSSNVFRSGSGSKKNRKFNKETLVEHKRSAFVQVFVLGFCGLVGPSLYGAIRDTDIATMSDVIDGTNNNLEGINGIVHVAAATASYFSGVMFNRVGPKPLIVVGIIGHVLYEVLHWFIAGTTFMTWMTMILALFLGLFTGITWIALNAMLLALPTKREVGLYLAIYHSIYKLSGIIISIIQIWVSSKYYDPAYEDVGNEIKGQLFPSVILDFRMSLTFIIVNITVVVTGSIMGLFALSPVYKIKRSDGSKVEFQRWTGIYNDLKEAAYIGLDPFVCKMFVAFLFSDFGRNYVFNYIIVYMFNLRSQGIAKLIYMLTYCAGAFICGHMLDNQTKPLRDRMLSVWRTLAVVSFLAYVLAMLMQFTTCSGRVDKNRDPNMMLSHNMTYTLAWFPPQGDQLGCDFLGANSELQFLQCVHEGYYGWCEMDIASIYTGRVCSRDPSFWDVCHEVDVNYIAQSLLALFTLIFVALSDIFLHMTILWMISSMAGPRNTTAVRYVAVYFALKSIGLSISWFIDLFDMMLYRYQGIVCAVMSFFSVGATYASIGTIEQTVYKRMNMGKTEIDHIDYYYYYSYYDSDDDSVFGDRTTESAFVP